MGWADWLTVAGGLVGAWGAYQGGREAEDYYNQAANIQRRNADIQRQNDIWAAQAVAQQAEWDRRKAQIDYARAEIAYQWAEYETAYKLFQSDEEARFDAYMADLNRHQAEVVFEGEKDIAEKREALAKDTATQAYEEKMDTLRHIVAETAALGGKSGFQINAGSFMSALKDQTAYGTGIYTETRRIADETAELSTQESLLRAQTARENRLAEAERYDLAGKIALESGKLASLGLGMAGEQLGLAGRLYGLAEEQYGYGMDRSRFLAGQAENVYGINMAQAGMTEGRGRSARRASWITAGAQLLSAFGRSRYGEG